MYQEAIKDIKHNEEETVTKEIYKRILQESKYKKSCWTI